jgi:hypothetical protein
MMMTLADWSLMPAGMLNVTDMFMTPYSGMSNEAMFNDAERSATVDEL